MTRTTGLRPENTTAAADVARTTHSAARAGDRSLALARRVLVMVGIACQSCGSVVTDPSLDASLDEAGGGQPSAEASARPGQDTTLENDGAIPAEPRPHECYGKLGTGGSCEPGYTCGVLAGGEYPFCIPLAVNGTCPDGLVLGVFGDHCVVPCASADDCRGQQLHTCSPDPFDARAPGWCAP